MRSFLFKREGRKNFYFEYETEDGEKKQESAKTDDENDARDYMAKRKLEILAGTTTNEKTPWDDFVEYYEVMHLSNLAPSTLQNVKCTLLLFKELVGTKTIQKVSVREVDKFTLKMKTRTQRKKKMASGR
ncbi:MAG: hypothetical protein COA78_05615 [Blastopirellula sp.]|nr:MAG: hypothetical protein COA78_05615 [Blastopirellula sp.]